VSADAAGSARPALDVDAVLFDLDGTLIDSAPDLGGAGNDLRMRRGLAALPLADFRPMTSGGARGMLSVALGLKPEDEGFEAARVEFLQIYEARMTRDTHVFPDVLPLLAALQARAMSWGIVTNKITRFTVPIVQALGLTERSAALVCGDTTPHAKPHPAPMFEAARQLGLPPARCAYVGDDLRDIQAGRAAGMPTVAVAWGYLGQDLPIGEWGADFVIEHPAQLQALLGLS
jgi:phosphoglycolate phosphatase